MSKTNQMALLPVQKYFFIDEEIKEVSDFIASENEGGIYEVIRVEKRVPLFVHEHLQRFNKSAKIAGKFIRFTNEEITSFIINLIEINNVDFGNILISCKTKLKVFFIEHKYPDKLDYLNGVKCDILFAERENPNAKVFQTPVRQKANQMIADKKLYEVLLANSAGQITEGSRSNVFFIKGNQVFTPPPSKVLLGITRQKTIEIIQNKKLIFSETEINVRDLSDFDAAFITGTSPQILPVNKIGELHFDVKNQIVQQLVTAYQQLVASYIEKSKR